MTRLSILLFDMIEAVTIGEVSKAGDNFLTASTSQYYIDNHS